MGTEAHLREDCKQVHANEWHREERPAVAIDEVDDEHEEHVGREREQQQHARRLRVRPYAFMFIV